MPSFDVTWKKAWGVPYAPRGIWIKLSHGEACTLTGDIPREAKKILKYLDIPSWAEKIIEEILPMIEIAREVLKAILTIKSKNETSNKKGVKFFFNFWDQEITKIHRRSKSKKRSPCN